ncbi:uncharacterized protein LOC123502473 isoform X2 [Portunus trituberculatus]|uniref:uncharacterized protein LOC123502473 isoform X2 n=1 Tax=Portunus trituberculatus TaxID=210409 RepID=UPI001E1D06C0|nr:uncharacterized protein LOC123502473 isoform X2 [Portunus trituberculatus]
MHHHNKPRRPSHRRCRHNHPLLWQGPAGTRWDASSSPTHTNTRTPYTRGGHSGKRRKKNFNISGTKNEKKKFTNHIMKTGNKPLARELVEKVKGHN